MAGSTDYVRNVSRNVYDLWDRVGQCVIHFQFSSNHKKPVEPIEIACHTFDSIMNKSLLISI
jgi:hypothetical protein